MKNPLFAKLPLVAVGLAAGAGLVALASMVSKEPERAPGPLKPKYAQEAPLSRDPKGSPAVTTTTKPGTNVDEMTSVRVVTVSDDKLALTKEIPVPAGQNAHVIALSNSFANMGYKEFRVLAVDIEKGVATVDVSSNVAEHGYGSDEESHLIKGIGLALSQFSNIKSFQLRSDGQVIDTLGHFEMTEPVTIEDAKTAGEGGGSEGEGSGSTADETSSVR